MGSPMELHRDGGTGDPVVLLHGFPDTAPTWDRIADALESAGHRVVVPHLRGYTPGSVDPDRPYDGHTLALDVLELMDDLDLDSAALVGHDWGASMAYGAASLAPERVTRLVGVAIPHPRTLKPTPRMLLDARHFLALRLPWATAQFRLRGFSGTRILYRRWAPGWSGPDRDACVERFNAAVADPAVLDATLAYYRALSPRPDRRLTARLPMPTLVVGGTRDIVPAAAFAASAPAFTGEFTAELVEGAGHWPHREGEARFIDLVTDFLG